MSRPRVTSPAAAVLVALALLLGGGCGATAPPLSATNDFERAMLAGERALRDLDFDIERVSHRDGVIVTRPLVASQPLELAFRGDVRTIDDAAKSALATYQRTVTLQVNEDGTVEPTVLVERHTVAERRVTDPAFVGSSFRRGDERGTPETDRGVFLPYFDTYAVGEDEALAETIVAMTERRKARF